MIPLRLTVKNFMCYRDGVPTLDLEGVHVACLCGDNGNGKTALLDAITWALWGHARARTQEELVHQGSQDMAVDLEFLARGQRYRVSRRHSRSARARQGATIMELQVASDDGFRPITGNSVRETEAHIRDILNMDYETFINTAFLRQGDADRFTTSAPATRKQTLAEVLDLSYYQCLEERARTRSRAMRDGIRDRDAAIALWQPEISRRPDHEKQIASVRAELGQILPEAEGQRRTVEELRRGVDSLQARRREMNDLVRRLADAQGDLVHLKRQAKSQEAKVADHEGVLRRDTEIRGEFSKLQEGKAELKRLDQALARRSALDGEVAALEKEVAVQTERLSGRAAQLRKKIEDDLAPRAERLPEIERSARAIADEQANLAEMEEGIDHRRTEAEDLSARARDVKLANERLRQQMEETRNKFDMLERGESVCPLCRQPLGTDGQEHLRREYESEGRESKRQYKRNAAEHKALELKSKEARGRLSTLEAQSKQRREDLQRKGTRLERDKADSEQAQADLIQATGELKQLDGVLAEKGFAVEERRRLDQLLSDVSELGYDSEQHQRTRERVKELEQYDELHRRLLDAVDALPAEREALAEACGMLERRQHEIRDSQERKGRLECELDALPSLESRLKEAQTNLQNLQRQEGDLKVQEGVLEKDLKRCDELKAEVRRYEGERSALSNEKAVYDELATAFGKNGIQALIIETAIPQLESDANELLGRLTDSRMFLKLQLQEGRKDARTGLPSEELDIRIADEVGTRSYETFSGGEAFRINFALRIALSKLLARRSGAPLPILFIDEGFGTQDSAGQDRLTQAIQSIQDDFEKIIVITHIEQIKESFPVRIEVTKSGGGSTFEVV